MLNPLVLVYGVGGVHNDVFVLCLLLGGVLLAAGRGAVAGGGAWAAAAAIKLSAGLALPFLLLGAGRRRLAVAGAAAGALVVGAVIVLAFGGHLPNDAQQSRLVMGLSPGNLLGLALGRGGMDPALRRDLSIALVVGTLGLAAWAWRTGAWAAGAAWAGVLLLLTLGWVMPWYVLWVLPFAALARHGGSRAAAIALTVFLLAIWAPGGAPALHRLGAHVTATPVGRVNNHFMHGLLR
jgi:alpha-1,6-mannosyltransferase